MAVYAEQLRHNNENDLRVPFDRSRVSSCTPLLFALMSFS